MGNIYPVEHSQSWNLEQAQSQSTLNTEHCTSINPQPGVKYIYSGPTIHSISTTYQLALFQTFHMMRYEKPHQSDDW